MEVKAVAKNIRMSAKKVRLVVDVIRGKQAGEALDQLMFVNKRAVTPVEKVLKSAIANAEHNFNLAKDKLYIKEIKVDEGFTIKRWMPRAFGRATPIRKRTSHITVVLGDIDSVKSVQKIDENINIKEADMTKKEGKKTVKKK